MKKSEATPGTKVIAAMQYGDEYSDDEPEIVRYTFDEYDDYTLVGVVRSKPASSGKVWVKWIEGERDDEEEVSLKVLSLETEKDALEKEFKAAEKVIREKVKEAALIVKEANKMAQKAGARSLQNMYDAANPLVDAMDASGWRSSSWGC